MANTDADAATREAARQLIDRGEGFVLLAFTSAGAIKYQSKLDALKELALAEWARMIIRDKVRTGTQDITSQVKSDG